MKVLRWLAFLPASFAASIAALYLWRFIHMLTAAPYIDVDSWLNIVFMEIVGPAVSGIVFVTVGALVVPSHDRIVAPGLAGLSLIMFGMAVAFSSVSGEYFSLLGQATFAVGATLSAVEIWRQGARGFISGFK